MGLQNLQDVYQTEKTDISNIYTLAIGEEMKYYQIPAYSDATFVNSSLSHLWSFLNLRTEIDYNLANQPFANGGLLGTALEGLPDSFYNYCMVGFSIPNSNYRVQTYGQNVVVKIPLDSTYTGMTSGLTATTIYSSFIYNQVSYSLHDQIPDRKKYLIHRILTWLRFRKSISVPSLIINFFREKEFRYQNKSLKFGSQIIEAVVGPNERDKAVISNQMRSPADERRNIQRELSRIARQYFSGDDDSFLRKRIENNSL